MKSNGISLMPDEYCAKDTTQMAKGRDKRKKYTNATMVAINCV